MNTWHTINELYVTILDSLRIKDNHLSKKNRTGSVNIEPNDFTICDITRTCASTKRKFAMCDITHSSTRNTLVLVSLVRQACKFSQL